MRSAFALIPAALLTLWVTGWFRRQTRRSIYSMGNIALGGTGLWVGLTWLWKNRRDAISVVAVVVLTTAVVVFLGMWILLPDRRVTLTAPVVAAAIGGFWAWDYRKTAGAPVVEWIGHKKAELRVRRAVLETHDNALPRATRRTANGWRVDVDHTGKLKPELVGQALQVGGASVVPSNRLGRSTIVLDNESIGRWEPFRREIGWSAPSSARAGDPVRFAFDANRQPLTLPWPGSGGRHILVGGSTGAGKSGLLRVLIAELAYRRNTVLCLCDPKMVEFKGWAKRAHVARGVEATGRMFDAVFAEMMRRYESLPDDEVEWSDEQGPWIQLVIDEVAAVTTAGSARDCAERSRMLGLILSMGRAAGIGVTAATQRPSAKVMDLDLRDNFRVRVGLGCESLQATTMIMGDSAERAPCTLIPESLPGVCFVRVDRHVEPARALKMDPLQVREIASATATNKGDAEWLKE